LEVRRASLRWAEDLKGSQKVAGTTFQDYRLGDLVAAAWRYKVFGGVVAACVVVLGVVAAILAPSAYVADAELLVLPDEAYVLDPLGENAGAGDTLSSQEALRSEVRLLRSREVRARLYADMGDAAVPDAAVSGAEQRGGEAARNQAAVEFLGRAFGVELEPNSRAMTARFAADDADGAADVLNRWLEIYLVYRRDVLADAGAQVLRDERLSAEARLAQINIELGLFLTRYELGDFVQDRLAMQQRFATTETDLAQAAATLAEARARLESLDEQLADIAPEVDLFVEDSASGELQVLYIEHETLLARYYDNAAPVLEIERRITVLEEALAAGAVGAGLRRRGVNPVRQTLETERAQTRASVDALEARVAALTGQVIDLRVRQRVLQAVAPEHQSLAREGVALEMTIAELASREANGRAARAIADRMGDRVRIIARAAPPSKPRNKRFAILVASVFAAGAAGVSAAAMRGLLNPPQPELRTGASRTIGAPVFAVAPAPGDARDEKPAPAAAKGRAKTKARAQPKGAGSAGA